MKAKNMFEQLGYKQEVQDDYIEYYIDCIDYPFGYYPYILFDLKNKCWNSNLEGTSDEEELAISQQIKELHWIMSDKELEEYIKKVEPRFNSHLEKGTIEMSNEYYGLLEERLARLINENQKYKEVIDKAIEYIETLNKIIPRFWFTKLLELLKEVK